MTVSEFINVLSKYPGDYHVIHDIYPDAEDTLEQDFKIISPEEYDEGIENGDIQ